MEPQRLAAAAGEFVAAWAAGPAGEARLRACLAPGVVFRPDGVVFHQELRGKCARAPAVSGGFGPGRLAGSSASGPVLFASACCNTRPAPCCFDAGGAGPDGLKPCA